MQALPEKLEEKEMIFNYFYEANIILISNLDKNFTSKETYRIPHRQRCENYLKFSKFKSVIYFKIYNIYSGNASLL